ncbi:MAG TPA: cupredoxin family copper-binding protein [Gammaproteobacteria bacterium]|jgi:amicyanin
MKSLLGVLFLAFTGLALVTGTVKAADPAKPAAVQVNIFNYKFDPETLTVPAGATVTWTNKDEIPHTVMSSDKSFQGSGGLDTGDSYSYTFTQPGTYNYYCTLHPFMKGKVVVTAAGN